MPHETATREIHLHAVRIIAQQGSQGAIDALLEVLRGNADFRSTLASETLVAAGDAAIPGLESLLEDEDEWIRWRATLCLSRIASKACLPALEQALLDDSPNVAWVAASGLSRLGAEAAPDVLRSVLNHRLSSATIRSLHYYADHLSPKSTFRELVIATAGPASGAATLTAIDHVLGQITQRRAGVAVTNVPS